MNSIDTLKSQNLLEYVQTCTWQRWDNSTQWKVFKAHSKDKTPSLIVFWNEWQRWYCDFSWHLWWWTIIDFQMNWFDMEKWPAIKSLMEHFWIEWEVKINRRPPSKIDLWSKIQKFRIDWASAELMRFLQSRWIKFKDIEEFGERIMEVSSEFGLVEDYKITNDSYTNVVVFPCYDAEKNQIGAKIRATNWEKIRGKKSKAIEWFKTWVIFDKILDKYAILVEWETDYLILKMLWYTSVIGNLWWVQSNKEIIRDLTKSVKKVISLYDNDEAWSNANLKLSELIWRPLHEVQYPEIEWKEKFDVNDLFCMWYRKKDFDNLLKNAQETKQDIEQVKDEPVDEWGEEKKKSKKQDRFIYLDNHLSFFDKKMKKLVNKHDIADYLKWTPRDLIESRWHLIEEFQDICYRDWWKPNCYNLLNTEKMLKPSRKAVIHPEIRKQIENLCWHREENIMWLHMAVWYKYCNLNDVTIPAVVFFWAWWSWKWNFMELLERIFGRENVQYWLSQKDILSDFSAYSWNKLIVQFTEVHSWNKWKDKAALDRIKTFVWNSKISVRQLHKDSREVDNIGWFFFESNHSVPIELDDREKWNRRFTIIKTGKEYKRWNEFHQAINDEKKSNNRRHTQ